MSNTTIPDYYHYMVKRNLTNRLITNPNDVYARKCLYIEYKFPLNPISCFVDLLNKLKNNHEVKQVIINSQFSEERRKNDPKLPSCSKLNSVLEDIRKNNVPVQLIREHLVKRKYIKAKHYDQMINVSYTMNIDRLIPLLESMQKYQILINNSNYKQIGVKLSTHLRCVLNSIRIAEYHANRGPNIGENSIRNSEKIRDILLSSCKILNDVSRNVNDYSYLEISRSERMTRDYRSTENVNNFGYGIPDILKIITSHFNIHVQKWVNQLNNTSKFKKQFSLDSWIGDMYFVYARYVLSANEINGIKKLCKT